MLFLFGVFDLFVSLCYIIHFRVVCCFGFLYVLGSLRVLFPSFVFRFEILVFANYVNLGTIPPLFIIGKSKFPNTR